MQGRCSGELAHILSLGRVRHRHDEAEASGRRNRRRVLVMDAQIRKVSLFGGGRIGGGERLAVAIDAPQELTTYFASSSTRSAPRSPTIIAGALVLPEVIVGKIEASMTRRPESPWTLSR